jgi:sugar phosphate isomerase/epimerase
MKFGVCGGVELMPVAAELGYDYVEMSVGGLLKPAEDKASFASELAKVQAGALPCLALNCLLPGTLKVVGPAVDTAALQAHVNTVCARAQRAGVRVIVFGSGGARAVPDGFDRGRAQAQLRAFCLMLGQAAAAHHLTIAVEPLRNSECNILNSVGEVAALVRSVQHPAIRLLVDAFHWAQEHDTTDAIVANADLLVHAHIATTANRKAPGSEPCDFVPFFRALRTADYHGTISIEAGLDNPAESLPRALALLQSAAHSSEY